MYYDKTSKKYSLKTMSSWEFMTENFDKIKEKLDEKENDFESKLFIETWTYKFMNDLLPEGKTEGETEGENKKEEELVYTQSDHMDYINLYKEKNKERIAKKNKLKPNRRIKVYKDKHNNKHKGPAFMIEEIEKCDKEGTWWSSMRITPSPSICTLWWITA